MIHCGNVACPSAVIDAAAAVVGRHAVFPAWLAAAGLQASRCHQEAAMLAADGAEACLRDTLRSVRLLARSCRSSMGRRDLPRGQWISGISERGIQRECSGVALQFAGWTGLRKSRHDGTSCQAEWREGQASAVNVSNAWTRMTLQRRVIR